MRLRSACWRLLLWAACPSAVAAQEDRPAPEAMTFYTLVKELRAQGFTCPDGTSFPPNPKPFDWDCRLWRAAKSWSWTMAVGDFIAHEQDGTDPCVRTEAEGYPHKRGCGENVVGGNQSPQEAMEQLKRSSGHCRNMLDPDFNHFGVGYAFREGTQYRHYWTQDFGSWYKAPDQACIGGAAAPTSPPGCTDLDTFNCRQYKKEGFCAYSPNVREQCKETCGLCNGDAPRPGACEDDTLAGCDVYLARGSCKNSASVRQQCKKSCGMCGPEAPPLDCLDEPNNPCDDYRRKGDCERYPTVRASCRLTCGICGAAPPRQAMDTELGCMDHPSEPCGVFQQQGLCDSVAHVRASCRQSCGLCNLHI